TGEGFLRSGQKAKAQKGIGLYILQGSTLVLKAPASMVGTVINRIACHPTDGNTMALATNKGILISTDGGATFQAATTHTNPLAVGQDVKFDANGYLYCSIGSELANNINTQVYKSNSNTYGTLSFSLITPSSPVLPANALNGRTELAIAPSNNNVV